MATGSPPRGQVASRRGGPGGRAAPRAARRGFRLPRAFTTPGKLWLVRTGALHWCTAGQPAGSGPVLGGEPNARAVHLGLERSYRALARLTPDEARRVELVDLTNAIRPRTFT